MMTKRNPLSVGRDPSLPVILLVGQVEDGMEPRSVFDMPGWTTHRARDCWEAALHLHTSGPCVVVCERYLLDCGWKDVLAIAAVLREPPPVIVTDRLADEHLWAEVLNLGGFDVLTKPLDPGEVTRVVTFAWEHCGRNSPSARRRPASKKSEDLAQHTAA